MVATICASYGWTPRELARVLNVAPYTVDRWVKGTSPPVGLARDVLTALHRAAFELTPEQRSWLGRELGLGLGAFLFRALTNHVGAT